MDLNHILTLPVSRLVNEGRCGVRLFAGIDEMMRQFAQSMADELRVRNAAGEPTRWILPVGPVAQYALLVEWSNRLQISWKNVFAFQMDEFLDWQGRSLPIEHPLSFTGYLRRELFDRLDAELRPSPENIHAPSPFEPDAISEAINATGGVDTCFGGIGYHGHVAFNEPPISRWYRISVEEMRQSRTRVVISGDDSIVVQSINFCGGSPDLIPPMGVTLGMKDILASRKIRLYLAGGERHRAVFRVTLLADPTSDYPSTLLQGHPDCILHTDEATARPIDAAMNWIIPLQR
jgi:glucosamine-6-phosphate deaminase